MKHFKTLNLRPLRKKRCSYRPPVYFPAIVFSMLITTCADLYFMGIGLYSFSAFTIHIAFTLAGVPLFTLFFLWAGRKVPRGMRLLLIVFLSLVGLSLEILSEWLGVFMHTTEWKHWYSFVGYFLFFMIVWKIFNWTNKDGSER